MSFSNHGVTYKKKMTSFQPIVSKCQLKCTARLFKNLSLLLAQRKLRKHSNRLHRATGYFHVFSTFNTPRVPKNRSPFPSAYCQSVRLCIRLSVCVGFY